MLSLDRDYIQLKSILETECRRRRIEFDFCELNPKGWADAMWVGCDGIYQAEIKGTGEILGDADHLIAQLKAQVPNADQSYLFVYGEMEEAEDGNSYSLSHEKDFKSWERGQDSGLVRHFRRRHHRTNFIGQRKILWRIRQEGIHVIECKTLKSLALELVNLYDVSQNVGTVFSRILKFREKIKPDDQRVVSVMSALPGCGEEIGRALVGRFGSVLATLNAPEEEIAEVLLGSGKRIGTAKARQFRAHLTQEHP